MSSTFVGDLRAALEVTNDEKYTANESRPDLKFTYTALKPDAFKPVEDNKLYALMLNDVKFNVSKCSTVFFAAVHITMYDILHSGLVIENDFDVTVNGVTTSYSGGHLVAHALYVKQEDGKMSTKLCVSMCSNRPGVFNELALVVKNAASYTRAMSPGFVSSTPCFQLVEKLRSEISKPFDLHWAKRLKEKVEKLGDNMTNCAIFAGRIFYALAPAEDKEEIAIKGTLRVFKELNFEEGSVSPYISAIKK